MKRACLDKTSAGNVPGLLASAPDVKNKPWEEDWYIMSNNTNDNDPPLPLPLPLNPKSAEVQRARGCAAGLSWVQEPCEYLTILLSRICGWDAFVQGMLRGQACRQPTAYDLYEWNGVYFFKQSLEDLGLWIQFGHHLLCERCTNHQAGHQDFIIIHNNSIHQVNVNFCACDDGICIASPGDGLQLYAVLEWLTNNIGVNPPDCYQVFLWMVHQYWHLLMLKRAGCRHDTADVFGTGTRELAVQCPVCPDPKTNLPDGWENAAPEDRFIYIFFLALDACFHLKHCLALNKYTDPELGMGWAYMSTCSALAALDYANTKFSRGYSTMGVGWESVQGMNLSNRMVWVTCSMGERFSNMDYIFRRLANLPKFVQLMLILEIYQFVIPKMHIHSHALGCQLKFSLNLVAGSGQTNGEGIEHPWSNIGTIATSTHVSGPGTHYDLLDNDWNFWNWLKTISLHDTKIGLAVLLHRQLDAARKEQKSQCKAFEAFTRMVEDFEAHLGKKNLYAMKISACAATGLTEHKVRLQFAMEESEEVKKGGSVLHEVMLSSFMVAGVELEEQQRCVWVQAELKKARTTTQQINMKVLHTKLNRGITHFRKLQLTSTPVAIQALLKWVAAMNKLAEDVPLMLPSSLSAEERGHRGCHYVLSGQKPGLGVAGGRKSIEFMAAEGMVVYAMRQANMYQELAEITRTEVKLQRGMKCMVYGQSWDPVMPIDGGEEEGGDAELGEDNADEEDDEWGDIESDEELLMGGEVDDD
ncbi:hypothetical protein B0H14DRAFT_2577530 [Mycena olivaceomarginata]|nr:hypothetical protein B0H14DRAFT_2577530 [Mycena olivaceomarginata]